MIRLPGIRHRSLATLLFIGLPITIATLSVEAQTPAPPATQAAVMSPGTPGGLYKVERHESFYVIGMSVNTTGDAEAKGDGKIPALWQQFMGEGSNAIPGKIDDDIYAIYSDYKADQSFSYTIAAKVASIDKVPAGMVALTIPAGRYAVVPSAVGPLQEVIPAMWQKIWTMSPAELGGKRSFKYDYNVLNLQGIDPQNAQVDAYVGLE